MALSSKSLITIAGAGSIGCYLGGRLAAAGRNVTLLLRERLAKRIASFGLRISDLEGSDDTVAASSLTLATEASAALATADVILVTVKCRDTEAMAELIWRHSARKPVIVSLQNGISNAAVIRHVVGSDYRVTAAMVPFNVIQTLKDDEAPRFHRASSGTIQLGAGIPFLRALLNAPEIPFAEHSDIDAILWSKLLLNLNNALNALSDMPLAQQLADRRWRLLLAKQMEEGLAAVRAAHVSLAPIEGIHPRFVMLALRLPDLLFKLAARRMLAIDASARSSMWEDLAARRPTEIDCLQGEIVRLAARHGLDVPLNKRVIKFIRSAERGRQGSPRIAPDAVGIS
jgi:2-dehydropantoate 2-reductase